MLALKACLQAKGYDWEFRQEGSGFSISGGSGLDASPEQQERERVDTQACVAKVDPARLIPPQLTASQLEEMYRYMLAQTACMRDAGYPVSDPPPLEVYLDTDRAFDPFGDLSERGIPFSQADLERCQMAGDVPGFLQQ